MTEPRTPPPTSAPAPLQPEGEGDGPVPLFGTWRAIHGAVVVCALVVMALVALFSRWPF